MIAVFTHKRPVQQIYNFTVNQKHWIEKAIAAAKDVGYETCLYTDDQDFAQGLNLDELHFISDEYNIWDSFKLYVLQNRTSSDYFLCDNDCIFHKYIEFDDDVDIYFDGIENGIYETTYFKTIKKLHLNGIINLSQLKQSGTINVGILKVNNTQLKETYIEKWKAIYSKVENSISKYPILGLTATLTQGILSDIVLNSKYSCKYFTKSVEFKDWGKGNEYYTHYVGKNKVAKPNELI